MLLIRNKYLCLCKQKHFEIMEKELMTTKEVCKYFNKTTDTIRRWSNEGKLTRKHIGRSVFYERSEVESLAK